MDDDIHEVERGLSLAAAMGFALPAGDDDALRVRDAAGGGARRDARRRPSGRVGARARLGAGPPRRPRPRARGRGLGRGRHRRGGRNARSPAASRARSPPTSAARRRSATSPGSCGAACLVTGNTGPAHLAAAAGTPVVSLYAPTVPAVRWRPWRVPHELLHRDVPCAGCRARTCPVPGHPCIDDVTPAEVLAAVGRLAARRAGRSQHEDPALARARLVDDGVRPGRTRVPVPVEPGRGPDGRGRAQTWDWPPAAVEVTREEARDAEVDVLILQRPAELDGLAADWLGDRRPPTVYLEHNAPQGRIANAPPGRQLPAVGGRPLPPLAVVRQPDRHRQAAAAAVADHGRGDRALRRGAGIWDWAGNDDGTADPDIVLACAGDVVTMETVAAAQILQRSCPASRSGSSTWST